MFFTLEVKMEEEKRKRLFWILFGAALFLENDLKQNTRRSKKNKATNIETLPNNYLRDARAIFQREYSRRRRILRQPQ